MNREERYTTVTLTINGESAKKTLDELNARAEALGARIAALKSATPAVSGDGLKVGDTTAEVKRLEGELAAVMGGTGCRCACRANGRRCGLPQSQCAAVTVQTQQST